MIEKLLDIARADSGKIAVDATPHKLQDLVRHYYETHYNYIVSRGFTFDLEIEPDLPPVSISPDHFITVLSNLVDNAIKYSFQKKHISVSLRRISGNVVFKVSDCGIGIPKKSYEQIFEKFYRLEDSMTAKTKGHGLGLSIVKHLVESNNGKVAVRSDISRGTTFIVEFPYQSVSSGVTDHQNEINEDPVIEELHAAGYAE